jgi:hypothetical protein
VSWLVAPTAQTEHPDYFPAAGADYVPPAGTTNEFVDGLPIGPTSAPGAAPPAATSPPRCGCREPIPQQ